MAAKDDVVDRAGMMDMGLEVALRTSMMTEEE
jgi:hypothetical protein